VLKLFCLNVPPQTTTAIVGSSGAGKSSALALLTHFYQAKSGRVLIDGRDVGSYGANFLRRHVALVQQEPVLFGIPLRDNVTYGCHREVKDEEVIEACKQANAHQFIASDNAGFPEGYQTLVGERGVRLSGGQKQRIAIARALILQPKILLLDEATSALDSESERLVQEAIDHVMVGRTVLIVAHRLSTVVDADQIAVCSGGAVLDKGRHEELLSRCPEYASLVKRQTTPIMHGPVRLGTSLFQRGQRAKGQNG
jgi:ATP-binding cassette subfamily B (MDR/TAP) protein 1